MDVDFYFLFFSLFMFSQYAVAQRRLLYWKGGVCVCVCVCVCVLCVMDKRGGWSWGG